MRGSVEAIYIGAARGQPMTATGQVRAFAGRGFEGDRYCPAPGKAPRNHGPGREATLIEAEAIEAVSGDCSIPFEAAESRRNLVTRGVALNHLVGREFRVGGVRMRGVELCEPCRHLQKLTRPGVLKALLHRGGLRAQILDDGPIKVGDAVEVTMAGADPGRGPT